MVEFNPSAFKHGVSVADILWAFDHIAHDSLIEQGESETMDKYLLIGFDINANPLEIMYNEIDENTVNVFHAMKCRNIYKHLL
ncbi:MAG: hypothetical protein LBU83_06510 [Bacteroidales bacterium]|nr:hypothetical protein [Bacteroidales bacterium]